jgi:hypothetical protein
VIATLAHVLHTPLTAFLAMPWDEIAAWSVEADKILASRQ